MVGSRGAGATLLDEGSPWPDRDGRRVVFLLDAASGLERRLLQEWIERTRPEDAASAPEALEIPPARRRRWRRKRRRLDPRLEACLATGDDAWLAPLRVAWFPEERDGQRAARLSDLVRGDPRDPGSLRARWLLRRHRDRCRPLAAEPAPISELRARWCEAGGAEQVETTGLAEFVVRRAQLALERAERRVRGAQYKVPRLVRGEILARPAFRGGIAALARELGRSEASVAREAAKDLREIAARHSRFMIDIAAQIIRWLYTLGYSEALRYDREALQRILALTQRHPVVFLPSHKSNLDSLVLKYAAHENRLPPNHTAGGINMNFFPVGALLRRTGVFFIRRSSKDDPVYKLVLRHYIDYLIEKRFPLEWYLEGGRSRSGKLLPPRFGLLAYVVDAYRRGKSEDVYLVPVSIAYDQIRDVRDYAKEQRGGRKQAESFSWFVRFARGLRARYGHIHIRFGEPLALSKALGTPRPGAEPDPDERSLAVQKLAFEVAVRINRVTPITPTSLVTLALLGGGQRAHTVEEISTELAPLLETIERRGLPAVEGLDLEQPEGVRRALEALVESGVLSCYAEGPEAVYAIGPEQHLVAAYYRNTIIHFFVNAAIAELALLRASEVGTERAREEFWGEAMRLRDLLKFEFFFPEKDAFRLEVRQELARHDPEWEARLAGGPESVLGLLRTVEPLFAHRLLRPFLEAQRIVADALVQHPAEAPLDESAFLAGCLRLGKQLLLQHRIESAEAISSTLFATALRLAHNHHIVAGEPAALAASRRAFADELHAATRRIDAIQALDLSRRAGLRL